MGKEYKAEGHGNELDSEKAMSWTLRRQISKAKNFFKCWLQITITCNM